MNIQAEKLSSGTLITNPANCRPTPSMYFQQSRQYRLLTLVAESAVRLLHPFKFQHVYIPVMPYSLVDYLEVCGWMEEWMDGWMEHTGIASTCFN